MSALLLAANAVAVPVVAVSGSYDSGSCCVTAAAARAAVPADWLYVSHSDRNHIEMRHYLDIGDDFESR